MPVCACPQVDEDGDPGAGGGGGFNGYQDGMGNGVVDEDQFQAENYRHDSFDQQQPQATKWQDEEEDWETQQREEGMWGRRERGREKWRVLYSD